MNGPASSLSIVGRAVSSNAQLEERICISYAAGRRAVQLKSRGLPFLALVNHWTHFGQPAEVRNAFYLGVEDEPA